MLILVLTIKNDSRIVIASTQGRPRINVDATLSSMKLFRRYRRRDINIQVAISNETGD